MHREDLTELHSIQPIANVANILDVGILSNREAEDVEHETIASSDIQDRRSGKRVPGGMALHEYANLYFDARNPMMSARRSRHGDLCVLRVSCDVLDLPDVVVTDANASSDYVRMEAAADGLEFIDEELVFAEDWRHPDQITYWRRKSARCAEVLVPNRVTPRYILGAYACSHGYEALREQASSLSVEVDGHLFFCE